MSAENNKKKSRKTMFLMVGIIILSSIFWSQVSQSMNQWAATDPACPAIVLQLFASQDIDAIKAKHQAVDLMRQGKFDEAIKLLAPYLDKPSNLQGVMQGLVLTAYASQGRIDDAEKLTRKICAGTASDPKDADVALKMHWLGCPMIWNGRPTQARPVLERAAAIFKRTTGTADQNYARELFFIARTYAGENDLKKALPLYEKVIPLLDKTWGPDSTYSEAAKSELNMLNECLTTGTKFSFHM